MSEKKKTIAICGTWLYEEKEFSFVSELNRICREKGYVAIAFNFSVDSIGITENTILEEKLMVLMSYLRCEAVIIMGETVKSERMLDSILNAVKKMNVPAFAMEKHIDGCINIAMKYGEGFQNIVRHVIGHHGCRKVNMIAGVRDNEFSDDRIQAYKQVLAEFGLPFEEDRLAYGDFWDRPAREATERFIESGDLPDAIVCANDSMAITACTVLAEHGIKVPDDIIVTGFDGILSGKVHIPTLSTVAPDNRGEIEIIFDVLDQIHRGEAPDHNITHCVDFKIQANQSCGCQKEKDFTTVSTLSTSLNDQKWHMAALNRMLLSANDVNDIRDLTPLLLECVSFWSQTLYFVAIYQDYITCNPIGAETDRNAASDNPLCYSLLEFEQSQSVGKMDSFRENEMFSRLKKHLEEDNRYEMFMVRLLHTNIDTYGYLVEGFQTVDERAMRRCEEFGLFLSTAFNIVLRNQKLMLLNSRLQQINKEMELASVSDYLTGLYNRRGFYDALQKIIEMPENLNHYLTFFSIDMDGLKKINDTYGHNEGDFALKTLAAAIRHFALRNGICARYGGDEFVCAIVTDQKISLTPDIVRERFQSVFDKNDQLQAKPYSVSASVGFQSAPIGNTLQLEALMRDADEAMYHDKMARKKNRS